jgi:DNA-binding NarL/FixJ family response regulator
MTAPLFFFEGSKYMQLALVHGHPATRQVIRQAVEKKLSEPVVDFSCVEDLMESSMQYDVLIVYNDLGKKMNAVEGVRLIRKALPDSVIIGVSNIPYGDRKFLPAGADGYLLRTGNEIQELTEMIRKLVNKKFA